MTSATSPRFLLQATAILCASSLAQMADIRASTSVYRCDSDGVTTFSDRPCSAAAELQKIDTAGMNTAEAAPVPSEKKRLERKPPPKAKVQRTPDPAKHEERCARLSRSLKDVRSKMRSGYTASEGERLRTRAEKLKEDLRFAKCR